MVLQNVNDLLVTLLVAELVTLGALYFALRRMTSSLERLHEGILDLHAWLRRSDDAPGIGAVVSAAVSSALRAGPIPVELHSIHH